MQILLAITAVITTASLLLFALIGAGLWFRRKRFPWRYAKWTAIAHVPLAAVYFFVGAPTAIAVMVVTQTQTRDDESDYTGPRIGADGRWLPQTVKRHRAERRAEREEEAPEDWDEESDGPWFVPLPDPALVETAKQRYVSIVTEDDVTVGGWHVPARSGESDISVVCVHGWFRGGLEVDPVGAMFHDLGCDVLLLELRGHGRSDARFTFGQDEDKDIRAAVRWLRARPGHEGDRVILFGVSIGAVAVSLAAPSIDGLAGIVLDAPCESLGGVAERTMSPKSGGHLRRRETSFPEPVSKVLLQIVRYLIGAPLESIRPIDGVRSLPSNVPALIVGGADDRRMPPATVTSVYEALPSGPDRKEVWIRKGSDHGRVWIDDPEGYRQRLEKLVSRARAELGPKN